MATPLFWLATAIILQTLMVSYSFARNFRKELFTAVFFRFLSQRPIVAKGSSGIVANSGLFRCTFTATKDNNRYFRGKIEHKRLVKKLCDLAPLSFRRKSHKARWGNFVEKGAKSLKNGFVVRSMGGESTATKY